ncbi:sulfite exporter TauE/SafE family protein [Methanocella sp. CWC-04]|uniref:Sulfite exporter TauE/SafE family protein n=1 Tax=Methanooceanicella nereidis TaxID=2052831 RepID=A0AAP2RCV9_9EURY|nr:aromatic aminobenezylarsenical efflux permease ArsG family transporter [Methanocella sp. CWC-04]MCD1293942.1 sulfite exporter TauE/SafE family protein [Methanocella sp. CWC-04]
MDLSALVFLKDFPLIYAFAIGIITAIGPCPLSANITAIAYVSSKLADSRSAMIAGIMYTLGRALTYTLLGIMIYLFGSAVMDNAPALQDYEKLLLGPVLILVGVIMLEVYKPNIMFGDGLKSKYGIQLSDRGTMGAFLLGVVFALAFCPYTAVMFFGLLVPLALNSDLVGMSYPLLFGIGTGLPVLIFALLLGVSAAFARSYVKKIVKAEPYIRKPIGAIFIIYGIYLLGNYLMQII